MLMTRETPEPPVAPLTDLDDSAAPSHQYQSHQYQSQQQGCQGAAPALYAHHQHASVAQYHSINSHHPGDIFSASPPRAAPSQATMYAGPDGMPHAVQQEHMPLGAGAPAGMSHFHGVTYNKGKWQASVFCNGRWVYCETFDTEIAAASAYDSAIRHFRPQDAELYVNFKHNMPMPQQAPMPVGAYQTYWEGAEGPEDGQSGVSATEGRAWVNHSQQKRAAAPGMVPQRVSSSNYPGMMAAGVSVIPSSMAPTMMSEDGTTNGFHPRGMIKSASVSTLMAQATISDSSAVPVSTMEAPMMQWPPGTRLAAVPSGAYDPSMQQMPPGAQPEFPNMSAASLLLGAEGGPPPAAQNPRVAPAGMKRVASAVDSSAMRSMHVRSPSGTAKFGMVGSPRADPATNSAGTGGSGGPTGSGASGSGHAHASLGVAEGGVRRVGSAQELASSVNKPAGGVRQPALSARSTRTAATRASNRRANSRYAKDKRDDDRPGAKTLSKENASGPSTKNAGVEKRPRTEEEMQAERMRVYQALLAGQERLHDQMRAHQAQHEEQQRRAAQREADKASEARLKQEPGPAAGSPNAGATSAGGAVLSGQAQASPKAQPQNSGDNDLMYGGNSRRRAARGSPNYPPTSEASTGSGGKAPRRIPSEPHSLASLGVAGMGGRHSPTVSRAMSGMRRVKSTHNFGHHQQQQPAQYMPMQHMQTSMAMPTEILRASPSMPVFPSSMDPAPASRRLDSLDNGQPLPNITEEREDPLKLPDSVTSMFLDDPEHGNDDLLSLMKDLTDHGANNGLDLDWTMPLESDGPAGRDSKSATENMPQSNVNQKAGSHNADPQAGQGEHEVGQHTSDLDPGFFHVEGADQVGMSMLDDVGVDDFNPLYLDL